jgi:hypothetical protein
MYVYTEKAIIIPPSRKFHPYQTSSVRRERNLCFANKYLFLNSIPTILPAKFGHRGGGIMVGLAVCTGHAWPGL